MEKEIGVVVDYAIDPASDLASYGEEPFGWLVKLINRFGYREGFDLLLKKFESPKSTYAVLFVVLLIN